VRSPGSKPKRFPFHPGAAGKEGVALCVEAERGLEMVGQVLFDLRRMRHHVDAVFGELLAVADAGEH
jgi:hypothetical protein